MVANFKQGEAFSKPELLVAGVSWSRSNMDREVILQYYK